MWIMGSNNKKATLKPKEWVMMSMSILILDKMSRLLGDQARKIALSLLRMSQRQMHH
jgi:hypothetical protein